MDLNKQLECLTSFVYEEDVNDVIKPPRIKPPLVPIRTIPKIKSVTTPKTTIQSKKTNLRVNIDSNGRVKIPKEWFGINGKLKFPKSELDKAVQSAKMHHRAMRRLTKTRSSMRNAAERMSVNYGREIQLLGKNFSFPNVSEIAMTGIVSIGIISGLSLMLIGQAPESKNENLQQAINNGTQLLGDLDQPMILKATQEITDLVNDLSKLNDAKLLPQEIKNKITHLADSYKLLKTFKRPIINTPADAQIFVQKTDELATTCEQASTTLQIIKQQISEINSYAVNVSQLNNKIDALSNTLDAIFVAVNNSKIARGQA